MNTLIVQPNYEGHLNRMILYKGGKHMKKIKMDQRVRWIITGIFIVGIIAFSMQAIKESKNIGIEQQEKIKYEYTAGTDINYAVNLVPNILYDTEKIYEEETYISEFIKSINVNFKMYFKGSDTAKIKGDYKVIAQMAGYTGQKEEKKDIWTKNFELVPATSFEQQDSCKVQQLVVIDYHTYDALAQTITEASKVNVPVELRIIIEGQMIADTAYDAITQPIASTLVIPLKNAYFNIEKLGVDVTTDAIKDITEITLPPNNKVIGQNVTGVIILIILLIILWSITTKLDATDIKQKEINKILKNHSSRLVAVDNIVETAQQEIYEVKTMDDLVKIADELEKPIIYQYNRNVLKINVFYVMDKTCRYIYRMSDEPIKEELSVPISYEIQESIQEESF